MIERCPICGTELKETNWGRKYCPNHGIIEESEEGDKSPSYLK